MDKQKSCHCSSCGLPPTEIAHEHGQSTQTYISIGFSLALLLVGLGAEHLFNQTISTPYKQLWYLLAYIPVAYPVLKEAFILLREKNFFTEFTLMAVATLGAFAIGEYPEAVAVMLFYTVGELFQDSAVNKAKRNIKALLDTRPETATVINEDITHVVLPDQVAIGETILIKAGEKVPLDGVMLSASSSFNTSALTGESRPQTIQAGEMVLAGMVNIDKVVHVKVSKRYKDSSFARIIEMVQEATSRKAPSELFIRKFAKVYTPFIFIFAVLITFIPLFFVSNYVFQEWLYRGLVFLVISCPCALVISVPLSYFGGIGAASKTGILFKGANYMHLLSKVNTIVVDKTGTLTEGVFEVQQVVSANGFTRERVIHYASAIEKHSNHPIAKAIARFATDINKDFQTSDIIEIAGQGLKGRVNKKEVLIGNALLMQKNAIDYDKSTDGIAETTLLLAIDNVYAGHIIIADQIKKDAYTAVKKLRAYDVKNIVMLSGDKKSITEQTARELGISHAYGELLPEEKAEHLKRLKENPHTIIAFVGDGINDAPSLAMSDVGIAMGKMGSDAAIEVADIIIQTDQPSKIATAIKISRKTRRIVYQNIVLALSIKLVILVLASLGVATMWEAVFADVGVALLAVLNAVRILRMKF